MLQIVSGTKEGQGEACFYSKTGNDDRQSAESVEEGCGCNTYLTIIDKTSACKKLF